MPRNIIGHLVLVGPRPIAGDIVEDARRDHPVGGNASPASIVTADDIASLAPELLAVARYLIRNDSEARDLAQAALEIGLRKRDQVRDPARLRAWLIAIETREAFRLRRRMARFVAFEPRVHELATGGQAHERSIIVREAIAGLSTRVRTAVVLHHLVGLTVEETAAAMSVEENTVKSQLRVGLSSLREALR
jgi:RNA polymerase sigma-70 factor, ECF subfamily